jgi:hypothetical protein
VFVIGAAIAGKQSGKIFIENGRFHGGVVIAEIAARLRSEGIGVKDALLLPSDPTLL